MFVQLLQITVLLSQVVDVDMCRPHTYPHCDGWGSCSRSCGGGRRSRICRSCVWRRRKNFEEDCNEFCVHGYYSGGSCRCSAWRSGTCCQNCYHMSIPNCVSGYKSCGGYPDNIKCTRCYDPYYPAGYGNGCRECPTISRCIERHCTERGNTKCLKCENNNVFFKTTRGGTRCERMCSFNTNYCWPGHCGEGLLKYCQCANGFRRVRRSTETSCQPTLPPVIETCDTVAAGPNGEKKRSVSRTKSSHCQYLDDMYGKYQPTVVMVEMMSTFIPDVSKLTKPRFIHEDRFGITDTTVYIDRKLINDANVRLSTHHQLIDTSSSANAADTFKSTGKFSVNQTLKNGEALCVIFEAYGGGYLKYKNIASYYNTISTPVPYQKTKSTREICYRFDNIRPVHCQAINTCHLEPISMQSRVTRSQITTVIFDGWLDPTPNSAKPVNVSGIESYQITVNEVLSSKGNLKVETAVVFTSKVNESVSSMTLNLTSAKPRLYSITIEVKDVADNTRQARRFMLYDNTSFIETWTGNQFRVTSASSQSSFTWQTHHHDVCLSWKDYFLNRFYFDTKLLNPIESDPFGLIDGIYEQTTGVLPVSGTPNVYGITKFMFSWNLDGGNFSSEIEVPNFLNQTYCNDFKVKDGQTYTLQIRPIDIANNTFYENRSIHVDRSIPHINNILLKKDGFHSLLVHNRTDLSTMKLHFEALDPHSGIRNVEWTFGATGFGKELLTGAISVKTLSEPSCPKNVLECYCPVVGKCEFFNYTIPLNTLVAKNKHEGNHNRNYFFTIKVTNHAYLTNIEHIDILVDDPPPEPGVVYEECPIISHCIIRHCTEPGNNKCLKCEDNKMFFKTTTGDTKCERMCSFNTHFCWPGQCGKGLTKNCDCADGFKRVLTETETSCQPTLPPVIETCDTVAAGPNGEKKRSVSRTKSSDCQYLNDIYGKYQPTVVMVEMMSTFILDVSYLSRPYFIEEERFGITDTTVYIDRKPINDTNERLATHHQLIDTSSSANAADTFKSTGNFSVNQTLKNGEALCVIFEAYGGGYLKYENTASKFNDISTPVPYQKTRSTREICYRFDSSRPVHCQAINTCHLEPISMQSRVTRSQITTVIFDGWLDPTPNSAQPGQASGIESYQITVNEVLSSKENLKVDTAVLFTSKVNESVSSMTLNLTSAKPRLYSITIEVKDVADNTRQARRFMLYDNTSFIETLTDNQFRVTSASSQSSFTWQTHHHDVCLSWKDYFLNRFYFDNKLLNPIESDPFGLIGGIYEQTAGVLPVSGTPNVYGITKFMFSWNLDGGNFSSEIEVPNFLNQTYCNDFKVKDGQTYTLQIRPIDIANNTFYENRSVHVDRSIPHINNIWLKKDGFHSLLHNRTDLSTMKLHFEALDPHSGIRNVEWTFGVSDFGKELLTGAISVKALSEPSCPKHVLECYCPDVGKCEFFNYSIPLNTLVAKNKHKGNHNRNYFFNIKVTNHAYLTNIEHIDILVDESPPEPGVVYEGPEDSIDIDYTSDESFLVHWHGFIDHESGIRGYRIGLADRCLGQKELYNFTANNDIKFYDEIPYTESSIRIPANFTGKRYVTIIALNNAMEPSESVCSDGVTRDLSPPDLRNVTLEHASWSERVACYDGDAWLFLATLSKILLHNISSCVEICSQPLKNNLLAEFLPTKSITKGDRDISDFVCLYVPHYNNDTVIYLPNDHIYLRWDVDEDVSQIDDFYVGIGTHPSEVNAPSIDDYRSTAKKKHFKRHHAGIGSNELFFIFLKVVNKAGLEKVIILGPVLIDETPPLKQRLPDVAVNGNHIVTGWDNDTFYDLEQSEQISSVFFQFGHDGNSVTPLLHWQLHVSESCPGFSGGCFKFPLTKLQSFDTDIGILFYVDMYVYNKAGHVLKVTTDAFKLPSRYPPGHAVIYDVDPALENSIQDTNVHFSPNTLCFVSSGFKHHESISIEIAVSSGNMADDIVPFIKTNLSDKYCLNSTKIRFDVKYFALVKASCSGGETTSSSNGVVILNEQKLIKNIDIVLGQDCSKNSNAFIIPSIQNFTSNKSFTFSVNVGMPYIIYAPFHSSYSLTTNDGILTVDSVRKNYLSFISFAENPIVFLNSMNGVTREFIQTNILICPLANIQNNRMTAHWYYKDYSAAVGLSYESAISRYIDTVDSVNKSLEYISPFSKTRNDMTLTISGISLKMYETYKWALKQCSRVRCLEPVYSQEFYVDTMSPIGNILTSRTEISEQASCTKLKLEWDDFESRSKILFYQWVISRDSNANLILTTWKTEIANSSELHKVSSCVTLPVYQHSTLYSCVRAFTENGNRGDVCKELHFHSVVENMQNLVYDFELNSDTWETVLQTLSSSNIGQLYTDFHNNELDFGTASTRAAGFILYATERNITWFLMQTRHIPENCDKSKDCITSKFTGSGYAVFSQNFLEPNTIYYICANSTTTVIERELFSESLDEINSCSDGFVLDTIAPLPGVVNLRSTGGFLTDLQGTEVTWDGFKENVDARKLGYVDRMKNYAVAIGSRPNGDDIQNYNDVGLAKRVLINDIGVRDGSTIFFSVKAVDHAGNTCTAVSKEYIVDTSPPTNGTISPQRTSVYHQTKSYITSNTILLSLSEFSDEESGIANFEIGVGTEPYFTNVLPFANYFENDMELHLDGIDLIDGHIYYVIARAVNHAGLKSSFAQTEMIVDRTSPTGGHVMEGHWTEEKDIDYQNDISRIQGHWKGFADVHSGILYYRAGLGTQPYDDDTEPMADVGLDEDITWSAEFYAGEKYFITVEACNGAGLCRRLSSNGITLDNSPPTPGLVTVGSDLRHRKYQSHQSSVHVHWAGFEDPQSRIDYYKMCVGKRQGSCDIVSDFNCLLQSNVIKTGLSLPLQTDLYVTVTAYNRVGMNVSKTSDAFRVDVTPPVLSIKPTFLLNFSSINGKIGQWEKSILRIYWEFQDKESPITSHDVSLITHHEGHTPVENLHLGSENKLTINLNGKNWLRNGERHSVSVTSCNQAGLCSSGFSDDLIIDSTPPHNGGFKQHMLWANLNDSQATFKSRVTLTWYGFFDQESGIRNYFVTVSHSYSGYELTNGVTTFVAETNSSEHVHSILLTKLIHPHDLLFLTIWAENNVGLNSSVARVSVYALMSSRSVEITQMKGTLEIEKHSCDVHSCSKDCTCAVVGRPCVEVSTNKTCNQVNISSEDIAFPRLKVSGGLYDEPITITASSACFTGSWNTDRHENASMDIKRFEWSIGLLNQPFGEGIYDLKSESPWKDIGLRNTFVHCLATNRTLHHAENYVIYVRAWFSFQEYAVFESDTIMVDQTAPTIRRGRSVLDSNELCARDFDIIDWMDTITACWNDVFSEQQGQIVNYDVSLGTALYADDILKVTNVGLATNITLRNISLSNGTEYFFTVSAYNNVGLHATTTSDGFITDMDNPTTGVVFNLLSHKNKRFQSSTSTLGISWHGFQDDFSGIRNYYAAIVDDSYMEGEVVKFTNVGLQTKYTFQNKTFKHGMTYYGIVRAEDNAGHLSNVAISRSVTIDTTPPEGYSCLSYTLTKQETIYFQADKDNAFAFRVNFTTNRLYKVSGNLTCTKSCTPKLILHIDRFNLALPTALNHNGDYTFEYKFIAPHNGVYNVCIEAENLNNVTMELALSDCDKMAEDVNAAVEVRQISPSDVAVNVVVLDTDSSIYRVSLGAGTTLGGFQIKSLSPVHHRNNYGPIYAGVSHGSPVYVTVLAENQAGLRAVFHAKPITIDHTAPIITHVHGDITSVQKNISGQLEYLTVVRAKWTVSDDESGLQICYCSIGRKRGLHDIQQTFPSQTETSCQSELLMLPHGELVYLNLKCVNNVELSAETSTATLVVSVRKPTTDTAALRIIPVNEDHSIYTSAMAEHLSVQSNKSCMKLKWEGFKDPSGIVSFQYRILKGQIPFIDWTMTDRQIVTIEKKKLSDGRYMAEVRALNVGNYTSDAVKAMLLVVVEPPLLSGHSILVTKNGNAINLNWSGVFRTKPDVPLSYSVFVGTRPGYTDILDLSYTSAQNIDFVIPESTIITPHLKELYIQVICLYATGLRKDYATTYKLE